MPSVEVRMSLGSLSTQIGLRLKMLSAPLFERYSFALMAGSSLALIAIAYVFRDIRMVGFVLFYLAVVLSRPADSETPALKDQMTFAVRMGAISGVLLLLIMGFNYLVNPYGIYATDFFDPIVFTSRREKVRLYSDYNPPPQIVILGTSRSFTVSPEYLEGLTGLSTFNASLHGGVPRDFHAFAQLLVESGSPPKLVILPLSPESFRHVEVPVFEPQDPLAEVLQGSGALERGVDEFLLLASLDQVESSLKLLEVERAGRGKPHYEFQSDGEAKFNIPFPLEQMVNIYLNGAWGAGFWDFEGLNPIQVAHFEAFLDLGLENGFGVIAYIPPFHPQAASLYEDRSNYPHLREELQSLMQNWQAEYDFTAFDFSDLSSFGGSGRMFHDAVHPNAEASRLMMKMIFVETP